MADVSVTLDDLLTRLEKLETRGVGYREELIFGSYKQFGVDNGTYNLTKPYTDFDAIKIISNRSNVDVQALSYGIDTTEFIQTNGVSFVDTDGGSCKIMWNSPTQFTVELGKPDWLYLIYGIHWGGVIVSLLKRMVEVMR